MFRYFTTASDDTEYPIKKYFEWNLIKTMAGEQIEKAKDYYRNREYSYPNNNPIIRLLKMMLRDPNAMDIFEYMDYVDNAIPYLTKQFLLVDSHSQGKVLTNVLMSGSSNETFIVVDNTTDLLGAADNWKELESIRVISSDITDVNYPVLFDYYKYSPGLTMFEIDLRAIAVQYYYWAKTRVYGDLAININVFFPMVVIPNILNSLMDIAIWNRYKSIASGMTIVDNDNKKPIALIDYTTGIDDVLSKVAKHLDGNSYYVTQLLRSVPMITSDSAYDVLRLSISIYTRQSLWSLWVSRADDITVIYNTMGKRGHRINKMLFNRLPYVVRNMRNREGALEDIIDPYSEYLLDRFMDWVDAELGKK